MTDQQYPPLLVMDTKFETGWKGEVEDGRMINPKVMDDGTIKIRYPGVHAFSPGGRETWEKVYPTDAHCFMYHVDGDLCPRINKEGFAHCDPKPKMGWLIVDVDTPDHVNLDDAPMEWISDIVDAETSIPELAHAIRWCSRGGYKYAWPLAENRQYTCDKGEHYLRMFIEYLAKNGLAIDEKCKDWTRAMRMPRVVREGDPKSHTYPVHGFDALAPLDWEPPEEPKAEGWIKKKKITRISGKSGSGEGSVIDVPPPDLDVFRTVVLSIDPDDYDRWREVGTMLRTSYGEDAWPLFNEWSAQGADYDGEDGCRAKWVQWPHEKTSKGITAGTVFYHAYEAINIASDDAVDLIDEARTVEDYYSTKTLTAAANLRIKKGPEWAQVVAVIKTAPHSGRFTDWEKAVVDREKEIKYIRSVAGAQFRAKQREDRIAEGGIVSNFGIEEINVDGVTKKIKTHVELAEIRAQVNTATGDWPRSFAGQLFVPGKDHGSIDADIPIQYVKTASDLSAYLQGNSDVHWTDQAVVKGEGQVRSANYNELLSSISANPAETYKKIEIIPHEPLLPDVYYTTTIEEGDGRTLDEFVDLFNGETDEDRQLIKGALVSPYWGGSLGGKPAFTITSDHGRGAGKSAMVDAIAQVYGGMIDINVDSRKGVDWQEVMQRILTDSALQARIIRIDNLKGRLDVGQLEAAITARYLSGKKMYHGDMSVPNTYSWFITVNSAEYSTDLAERSVVIKVGKPDYSFPFEARVREFMSHRRRALLEDIHAWLKRPAITPQIVTRFPVWDREVLGRFDNVDDLIQLCKNRRREIDAESHDAAEALMIIEKIVRAGFNGKDIDDVRVLVPRSDVAEAFARLWMVPQVSGMKLASHLKPLLKNPELQDLITWSNNRSFGYRGVEWIGRKVDPDKQNMRIWPGAEKDQDRRGGRIYDKPSGGTRNYLK